MSEDKGSRYSLAKNEVLDFLDKLKMPDEKYDLTGQPPFGEIERFTITFSGVVNNINDILKHNFRYSRVEYKEYFLQGTIVYFVVRKIRKVKSE